MPELPEVETVRRGLAPVLAGRMIARAEVRRAGLRFPFPPDMAARLTGRRVEALSRRAKFLLAALDSGETLLIHLGMSGRLLIEGAETATLHHARAVPSRHDHVVLHMQDGTRITFNDARRFGVMDLWPTDRLQEHPMLARLGPEPLGNGFHAKALAAALAGRRAPVKTALLDQRVVAGLGNIYVCEALWRAGIHPKRAAGRIGNQRVAALVRAIRAVLEEAIDSGGSTLRDFRAADGELGYFQHAFAVYDRAGRPCPRAGCKGKIARIVQGGRSTFYCPRCQR